ncbi:MAG: hypothetical protein ABSG53_29045, partial [Thermoguttaceae bacterium]
MDRIQKLLRSRAAWDRGRTLAEEEIAKGELGYREYGILDMGWADEVAEVLRERHQITLTVVGACITDIDVAAEAEGYNDRMIAECHSRFGQNI